eukprot:7870531-Ditylum_brightwellii.AAC.1
MEVGIANIRDAWSAVDLRKDCKEQFGWSKREFNMAHWSESGRIFGNVDYYHQIFITRYAYECLPVKGEKYLAHTDKTFPCCKKEKESTDHYMQCKENKERWEALLGALLQVFEKNKVDPVLRILIMASIQMKDIKALKLEHTSIKWEDYEK